MTRLHPLPAILLALLLATTASAEPPFRVVKAQAAPELDALFANTKGWIGADGNYSLSASPERALWFYSDTWVGEIQGGTRRHPVMVNNSVGVMTRGAGEAAERSRLQFFYGERDGKPAALWTPEDGRGWFWLFAPTLDANRLQVFLWQMEKAPGDGAFGFKNAGVALGEVANWQEPPSRWKLTQRKLPFTEITDKRRILFGSAVVRHDGYLYVYGVDERPLDKGPGHAMVVACVPEGKLWDFDAWRFRAGSEWGADFRLASPGVGVASEYSVTWLPALERFVAVYHDAYLSPNIVARTAKEPWGPWSEEKVTLYTCQEPAWKKGVFCYSGKAHAWLAADDELVVTYAANSGRLGDVIDDARLYVPRFVRVKVARQE